MTKYKVLVNYTDAQGRISMKTIVVWAENPEHISDQVKSKYGKGSRHEYYLAEGSSAFGDFIKRLMSGLSFVGLLLLALVIKTVFFDAKKTDATVASTQQTPSVTAPVEVVPTPDQAVVEPVVENNVFEHVLSDTVVSDSDVSPEPIPIEAPALQTYFVEVRHLDGTITTLDLVASDENKAREILRDFRGNPEILNGPSIEKNW